MKFTFNSQKRTISVLILLGMLFSIFQNQIVFAETSNAPSSESSEVTSQKNEILKLPAFDVSLHKDLSGEGSIDVGDRLQLGVAGIQFAQIDQAPGEGSLEDQGWLVSQPQGNSFLTVTPLKPGKLTLPSLILKDSKGKAIGRTNPFSLEVHTAILQQDPSPKEAEQILPPVGLNFPIWIVIAGVAAILILIVGLGVWIYRSKRANRNRKVKLPEITRTEDELALIQLAEVEKQGFLKKGNYKAFYFRISEVLKTYVGARYRFDAPESTTREMIIFLEDKKTMSDSLIDRLESMFDRLDRVKFTDHVPLEKDSKELLNEAIEFVKVTRRPPVSINSSGVAGNAS
jgi:hypothetical protein